MHFTQDATICANEGHIAQLGYFYKVYLIVSHVLENYLIYLKWRNLEHLEFVTVQLALSTYTYLTRRLHTIYLKSM